MNYRTNFRSIDLAACYRLADAYGMTDLTYNHITARVPGAEHHILINLYRARKDVTCVLHTIRGREWRWPP